MLKSMRLLPICALVGLLSACNAGTEGTSISAAVTSGSCIDMNNSNNTTCTITLTYNTGGTTGLSLGYTSSVTPPPAGITANSSFTNGMAACQSQISAITTSGSHTCPVTIVYSAGTATNTFLTFNLGGQSSGQIQVTGF